MSLLRARASPWAAAAAGGVVLDVAVRLVVGEPYPGATALLVGACGLALVPLLPRELRTPSLRLASAPVLGLGSFALLLTTLSIAGMRLTELSVRLAVVCLVAVATAAGVFVGGRDAAPAPRRERLALALVGGVFLLSLVSSLDLVEPYPPPGTDWAHNLQYAEQVAAERTLLVDDPYTAREAAVFANPPGIGAVYGSALLLDGVSSRSLTRGIAVFSALGALAVFMAVGGLWGSTAGLLAAAVYAVAPIRLETMYWHGLGTTLALVFVPLVLLAVGLAWRGRRDPRIVGLLGFSLAALVAVHPASILVLACVLAVVLVGDLVLGLIRVRRRPGEPAFRDWWAATVARPVAAGVAVGALLGAGAVVHLRRQTSEYGSLVDARAFDRDWLDADTVEYYFSWPFLALVAISLALVIGGRERRRDPALAALAALALGALVVSQLWRVDVAFEYRRIVYYLGLALVPLVGLASFRLPYRRVWVAACAVALVVVARESIGLRLPERLLRGDEPRSQTVDALAAFRVRIDRDGGSSETLLVADRCLGVLVPYIVRRPTLVSAEDWQVGYERLAHDARDATAIVDGGRKGRRLARERRVDYVLVDPECYPDAAERLGGRVAYKDGELVAVDVRGV